MNALKAYVRGVESLVRGLGIAAMYLLLVILAVLMFPVFARGGEISTIWTLETAQFAVGAYYILGAGWSLQQGAHVRMDFLYANWKPRTKAIIDAVTSFFVLFYLVIMLLGGWDSCAYAVVARQINHTVWAPYMAPIKIAMEIGIFFMFLQMTAEFVRSLLIVCRKPVETPDPEREEAQLYAGRTRRRTYWKTVAVCAAVGALGAALLVAGIPRVTGEGGFGLLLAIIGGFLAVAAPVAAIPATVRRFHDLDMSGWWAVGFGLFALVPGLGVFTLIAGAILLAQDGAPGTTGFGPDPKGRDLIRLFDPRIPKKPAPIPEVPVPAEPDAPRTYWTPYLVFATVGATLLAGGFALACACSNPTWFVLGCLAFLVSLLFLIRGALCTNR
ncbi:MAG: DUF805 domain-containing protein [Kiritimatiellia bacterium]